MRKPPPTKGELIAVMGLMFGMALLIIVLHPRG
jgi:hypothetical protein